MVEGTPGLSATSRVAERGMPGALGGARLKEPIIEAGNAG